MGSDMVMAVVCVQMGTNTLGSGNVAFATGKAGVAPLPATHTRGVGMRTFGMALVPAYMPTGTTTKVLAPQVHGLPISVAVSLAAEAT